MREARGVTLRQLFRRIADFMGVGRSRYRSALVRTGDIPHLVGDAAKLRKATGWSPTVSLEQTLREMVDAQAH